MAVKATLAVLVVVALASEAFGCIVRPGGCLNVGTAATCPWLPTVYLNPSNDYSQVSSWTASTNTKGVGGMAYYLGVYNKLSTSPAELSKPVSFSTWKSTKSYPFFFNLEKFPLEPSYLVTGTSSDGESTDLQSCCSKCAAMSGCVLYLYRPSNISKWANLTLSTSGKCFYLTGGSYKDDGPYDAAGISYGTPNAGAHGDQGTSNTTPIGYLGGSCNPGSAVINDPHFTGAHGTRFEFNGELNKPYCLVTDKDIHINAVLKGYKSPIPITASAGFNGKAIRSWIKELGLIWADAQGVKHSLKLTAREGKEQARGNGFLSSAELDGAPLTVPTTPGASVEDGDMVLTFLGTSKRGWYEVDSFSLSVGKKVVLSFEMRVAHPKLQSPTDAEVHFNLMFSTLEVSENVHGVLGQTYRNNPRQIAKALKFSQLGRLLGAPVQADGPSGSGFLDGAVPDCVSSSVVAPDCKMSKFGQ